MIRVLLILLAIVDVLVLPLRMSNASTTLAIAFRRFRSGETAMTVSRQLRQCPKLMVLMSTRLRKVTPTFPTLLLRSRLSVMTWSTVAGNPW